MQARPTQVHVSDDAPAVECSPYALPAGLIYREPKALFVSTLPSLGIEIFERSKDDVARATRLLCVTRHVLSREVHVGRAKNANGQSGHMTHDSALAKSVSCK